MLKVGRRMTTSPNQIRFSVDWKLKSWLVSVWTGLLSGRS